MSTEAGRKAYAAYMKAYSLPDNWNFETGGQRKAWETVEAACTNDLIDRIRTTLDAFLAGLKVRGGIYESDEPAPLRHITIKGEVADRYLDGLIEQIERETKPHIARFSDHKVCAWAGPDRVKRWAGLIADADKWSPSQLCAAHERLAPDFETDSTCLIGFHPEAVETARRLMHDDAGEITTITVNLGPDLEASGVYEITKRQIEILKAGETVELKRIGDCPPIVDPRSEANG
jgi:hypothetical protein